VQNIDAHEHAAVLEGASKIAEMNLLWLIFMVNAALPPNSRSQYLGIPLKGRFQRSSRSL